MLRGAVARFGAPAAAASGSRTPGALEAELSRTVTRTAKPGGARAYGKLAGFCGTVEAEMRHYESLSAQYERRLRFSPDADGGQAPLRAFRGKKACRAAGKKGPRWAERGSRG